MKSMLSVGNDKYLYEKSIDFDAVSAGMEGAQL